MSKVSVRVDSVRLQRRLRKMSVPTAIVRPMARHLFGEAHRIMALSAPLVPFDTGALRASGFVDTPRVTPNNASVKMQYGGNPAPYAVLQHENIHYHHPTPGTQAHYLSQVLSDQHEQIIRRLEADLNAEIRRMTRR
jgi:hypothetical protein